MKKKHISIFIVIIVLVTVCAVGAGLVYAAQKPTAVIPYEETLSKTTSPYTETDLAESSATYLLDADFEVTADNFQQCFYDFLAAPARLYFYLDDGTSLISYYKCDDPKGNTNFANAFQNVYLTECSEDEYKAMAGSEYNTQVFIFNVVGTINILCYSDYSCVMFGRDYEKTASHSAAYFYTEDDVRAKLATAYEEVLPYSMEAPVEEVE